MNRDNGFRSVANYFFEPGRVHRVSTFIYIDKDRPRSTIGDCFGSRHECVGYSYDFIAGSDAARQERQPKSFSTAADADCVLAVTIRRKLLFEFFDKRPARQGTRVNHLADDAVKLITETRVMRFQVEEWHSNVHLFWGQVFTTGATEPSTARFGGRPNATGVALSAINTHLATQLPNVLRCRTFSARSGSDVGTTLSGREKVIGAPLALSETEAASRICTSSSPSRPPLTGKSPVRMQSIKCWQTAFSGSS